MKRNLLLTMLVLLLGLAATSALAQDDGEDSGSTGDGDGLCEFIDEDGDGFNDLAPDADGDGIPNGLDPDYVRPQDGSGMQYQWGRLDDFLAQFGVQTFAGDGVMNMFRHGPGDGTGDTGPNEDGAGFGPGTSTGEGPGSSQGNGNGGSGGTGGSDDDSSGNGRGGSGGNGNGGNS